MQSKSSKKLSAERISDLFDQYRPQIHEIRGIIIRSLFAFVFGFVGGLVFNRQIILKLVSFFDLKTVNIVLTSPYQLFNLAFGLALIIGIITFTPVFIFQLLHYLRPALKHSEYVLIKNLIPLSIFLFLFGCFFGAKIEQFVVSLYSQTSTDFSLGNYWDIEKFLSQIITMSFTMGLVFQLPIILTILMRLKFISKKFISSQRRYFYLALTIFGVILPPTDVLSLIMIISPLFLLFEGTLLLNHNC